MCIVMHTTATLLKLTNCSFFTGSKTTFCGMQQKSLSAVETCLWSWDESKDWECENLAPYSPRRPSWVTLPETWAGVALSRWAASPRGSRMIAYLATVVFPGALVYNRHSNPLFQDPICRCRLRFYSQGATLSGSLKGWMVACRVSCCYTLPYAGWPGPNAGPADQW